MLYLDKRYHSLNYELRKTFNTKVIKLSIDGNFTCPNRDGKKSNKGCLFCSELGSGEFSGTGNREDSIDLQINKQIKSYEDKWPNAKYLAYFQNFTNTYDTITNLKTLYYKALNNNNISGIVIATRVDELSDNVIKLLSEINKTHFLWVEIGLQTKFNKTHKLLRTMYTKEDFLRSYKLLKANNIKTVVHLIANLPTENKKMFLESVNFVSKLKPYGIKLHMLNILKKTDLETYYKIHPFEFMSKDDYINLICDSLEILHPSISIHRITGDGAKDLLIEPKWILNKRYILNGVDKELAKRDSYQGKYYKD
ncbi:TIGR01212 family radical SAM protein [Helicovermis profundi]|uniref:TIGR01212 family radical SAM protein n=1 Tax=Helicovermis profundi TaxID=3065157 RepID=A0AAU9E0U2_9FIRM|nr:TIGR01212 family radical SAM protein [Clostridia bacterium S502]